MERKLDLNQYTSGRLNNHKLSLGAGEEVTYHISGEQTADTIASPYDIYFKHNNSAIAFTIRASVACSLTEVNGEVLKSPLTLNVGTNTFALKTAQFKIVSTIATVIEVTIK